MINNITLFKVLSHDIGIDNVNHIIKCLDLKIYNEGDIVFMEGDTGDNYYIILEGSVNVGVSSSVNVDADKNIYHHKKRLLNQTIKNKLHKQNHDINIINEYSDDSSIF